MQRWLAYGESVCVRDLARRGNHRHAVKRKRAGVQVVAKKFVTNGGCGHVFLLFTQNFLQLAISDRIFLRLGAPGQSSRRARTAALMALFSPPVQVVWWAGRGGGDLTGGEARRPGGGCAVRCTSTSNSARLFERSFAKQSAASFRAAAPRLSTAAQSAQRTTGPGASLTARPPRHGRPPGQTTNGAPCMASVCSSSWWIWPAQ